MATLEKIRSKSVFLIIVIGVALLAFIVGDAITNSRNLFGDHTVVAKVGGQKIDYTDYVKKREELNQQLEQIRNQNPAQYANFDTQLLSQMALDQLVGEVLLDKAVDDAGIRTSGEQLRFFVMENPINPRIQQIIQQLQASGLAVSTPQQAYEVIFNPTRNGLTEAQMAPMQRFWLAMEEETKQMIARQQYQNLLSGTIKANKLDKLALYNDYVSTSDVTFAYQPFGNVDPQKYPVSDSEIQAVYNETKSDFMVAEPTKDVQFLAVSIAPSIADREASKMLGVKTAEALRASSSNQLPKDIKKEGVTLTHKQLRASDIPAGAVREFLASANPNDVQIISDGIKGFQIVRMGSNKMLVDSIQLNLVQVIGETLPAKVLARLNSTSLSADSIAREFGDSVMAQMTQDIALFSQQGPTNALEKSQIDSLLNAGGKYISLMTSPQGAVLAQVSKRNAPVSVYEFDEVNYELKPSTATINAEREKLDKFLEENATSEKFITNAAAAGYTLQDLSLSKSTPAVPRGGALNVYYPDSRQVVRWVMIDGKPGQVSHIYESKDAMTPALYAVAVTEEYENYIPLSNIDVNTLTTARARRQKAASDMIKALEPKAGTIQSAAQAMNAEPQNNPGFRFGYSAQVTDPKIMGQIAGSKPGKVILVNGEGGIYAYQINSQKQEQFPYSEQQFDQQYYQLINPNFGEMLKGNKEYTNNLYKFEAGD